jgi:hypothetical protein
MSRFTCLPGDAAFARRAVLAGASALVALGTAARAASVAELVGADGRMAPGAAALADRRVRLVGYLAPSFEPGNDDWRLSEAPAMPCQLCGAGHDDGPAVLVRPVPPPDVSPLQAVAVIGRVEFWGGAPRLVDARVEAL